MTDWEKICSCFTKMKEFESQNVEGLTRNQQVDLAAKLMKPRQDVKRLKEQIHFVCFGD